jgi:hypothetical protein
MGGVCTSGGLRGGSRALTGFEHIELPNLTSYFEASWASIRNEAYRLRAAFKREVALRQNRDN